MIAGLIGTFISIMMFGFSTSFAMAVLSRFLWGLLNGNLGVARSYLAEVCLQAIIDPVWRSTMGLDSLIRYRYTEIPTNHSFL